MAQELIGTPFEDALIRGEKHFMVDYSKIDVEFKEIPSEVRQWLNPQNTLKLSLKLMMLPKSVQSRELRAMTGRFKLNYLL